MNKPNPGSKEAIDQGCKCPVMDNRHGLGVYFGKDGKPLFWYSANCEIHADKFNDHFNADHE